MTDRRLPCRCGFTLLEVILAIALSAVVILLLFSLIAVYLRTERSMRAEVEQAQLARALLHCMADDLRATITLAPEGEDSSSDLGGEEDTEAVVTTQQQTVLPAEDVAGSVIPPAVPGLYGNQYELQVDISRPPGPDKYMFELQAGSSNSPAALPGTAKTVAYYMIDRREAAPTAGTIDVGIDTLGTAGFRGLFRRALDRAVAKWAGENGNTEELHYQGELIAPEVVALEFRYFDGTQWLEQWDTAEQGGLPVAVEIALAVSSPERAEDADMLSLFSPDTQDIAADQRIYRLLVQLPAVATAPESGNEGTSQTQGQMP